MTPPCSQLKGLIGCPEYLSIGDALCVGGFLLAALIIVIVLLRWAR